MTSSPPNCSSGIPKAFLEKLGSTLEGKLILVTGEGEGGMDGWREWPTGLSLTAHSSHFIDIVSGGAGFLGGHIVQVLLQAKARVRVFDVVAPRANHGIWTDKDPVQVVVGQREKEKYIEERD